MRTPRRTRPGQSLTLVIGVGCFLAGAAAVYFLRPAIAGLLSEGRPAAPGAETGGPTRGQVNALGEIAPAGGVIDLTGPPGDRVAEIEVAVGDRVEEDRALVRLASHALREAELKRLRVQKADAQKQYDAVRSAGLIQIRQIERQLPQLEEAHELAEDLHGQKVDLLRTQLTAARNQLQRLESVGRTVPEAQKEQQRLQVQQLEGELQITIAGREQQRKVEALEVRTANDNLETAREEMKAKLSAIPSPELLAEQEALAELQLEQSVIRAPAEGTVLRVFAQEGEPTGAGPLLQMADLSEMVVVAEVYEDDIPLVREWFEAGGVAASVTNRALREAIGGEGGALEGQVVGPIGRVVGRNRVMPLDPVADADRRVVEVRVRLDDPSVASDFVGMQVDVALRPR